MAHVTTTRAIVCLVVIGAGCTTTDDQSARSITTSTVAAPVVETLPSVEQFDDEARLVSLRSSPNDLLIEALRRRDLALVRDAVDRGADLEHRYVGEPMFLLAAAMGFDDGVRYFLDAGIDVDTEARSGATAVMRAAERNHATTLQLLVDAGADLERQLTYTPQFSALLYAARSDNGIEALEILLDEGVDVNEPIQFGDTALAVAASAGAVENTQFLLAQGADIDARGNFGRTPLEAAENNRQAATASLIAAATS